MKTMNNKIRLRHFLEIGGVVEIHLMPEVRLIVHDAPLILCAKSEDEYNEMWTRILRLSVQSQIPMSYCIRKIDYLYNGIGYENPNGVAIPYNPYLYARWKYYRGATL